MTPTIPNDTTQAYFAALALANRAHAGDEAAVASILSVLDGGPLPLQPACEDASDRRVREAFLDGLAHSIPRA